MDKVAFLHNREVAREPAIEPKINDKYNTKELNEFYHRMARKFNGQFDNSKRVELFCMFLLTEGSV